MIRAKSILTVTAVAAITAGALLLSGCGETHTERVDQRHSITTRKLDPQDFRDAARDITNQMLAAPRVQQKLAQLTREQREGQLPLLKISRITNNTGLKINMIDYLVTPIDATLINSGKVDTFSEDRIAQGAETAKDMALGRNTARFPDLVMYGTVSRLTGVDGGTEQNAYTFHVRLSSGGVDIFVGDREIIKQTR